MSDPKKKKKINTGLSRGGSLYGYNFGNWDDQMFNLSDQSHHNSSNCANDISPSNDYSCDSGSSD